jgi:hypothetical protein
LRTNAHFVPSYADGFISPILAARRQPIVNFVRRMARAIRLPKKQII